jgi:hypothetical protein
MRDRFWKSLAVALIASVDLARGLPQAEIPGRFEAIDTWLGRPSPTVSAWGWSPPAVSEEASDVKDRLVTVCRAR